MHTCDFNTNNMNRQVHNNNLMIFNMLLEEEEEEDQIIELIMKKGRRNSIKPMFLAREGEGYFEQLIKGHLVEDQKLFREFFRLNFDQFNFLLSLVRNDIATTPYNRVLRPITPEEKLAVTLRYMATGESFRSLSFSFRISNSYISKIVKDTLYALKMRLMPIFLPNMKVVDLKTKADEFWRKWNFPNCVLAIDGKHVRVRCPNNTGSLYYNYKDYFSIVLLALVDANYKFVAVDVGSYGREGDSGIFLKSAMGQNILNGTFGFPEASALPGSEMSSPYVILGDEAFRLHTNIMKPYTRKSAREDPSKAIFNYRLSRARRVTENAFGLLSQVFRVFYQAININPNTCDNLILVACCLHNMLREGYLEKNGRIFYDFDQEDSRPVNNMMPIVREGGFGNAEGFQVRDAFKNFFMNEGAVTFQ